MTEKYCTIRVVRGLLPCCCDASRSRTSEDCDRPSWSSTSTTALIGENSAGKTTLLDAVAICCSGRDDTVTLEVRDFRQEGQSPPSESLGIALTFEGTDAEWAEQVRAPFLPFLRPGTPGRRVIRLEVSGRRHPERNAVEASWTFAGGEGRSSGPQPGLLAEWRRLTPMLRLRANRYVEQDPRGTAAAAAAGGADTADATDPVARQLEQQIRLIYDRLTGASDIQDDELRRGLDAAEAYLSARGPLPPRAGLAGAALDRAIWPRRLRRAAGAPSRSCRASSRAPAPEAWRSSG